MSSRSKWTSSSSSSTAAPARSGRWAVRAEGRLPAVPRFATPRRHDRPTRGHRVAKIARAIGQPFLPWQAELADVAGEYNPDTGVPYYGVVIVTVPRQSGKTTEILAQALDRCINWPTEEWATTPGGLAVPMGRQSVVYTAQTGQAAREKMLEDHLPLIEDSELVREFYAGTNRTNGAERIRFKNRSAYRPLPTTKKAGHGGTNHLAFIDEAFDEGIVPVREGALSPTMLTVAHSQLWVLSTAGTEASVYFNDKIEIGRAAVAEGASEGICYVEFSAEDPDVDIDDEEVWWDVMPALGYTQSIESIRTDRDSLRNKPSEFRRAYLNISTVNTERVIPLDVWASALDEDADPPDDGVVIAADADRDLTTGSVAVCSADSEVELVDVVDFHQLTDLIVRVALNTGGAVVIDFGGPLNSIVGDLEHELGTDRLVNAGPADVCQAAAEFYAALGQAHTTDRDKAALDGDTLIAIRPDERLDSAAAAASKRKVGDRWAWVRHPDAIPIVAASLAYWGRRHAPTTTVPDIW